MVVAESNGARVNGVASTVQPKRAVLRGLNAWILVFILALVVLLGMRGLQLYTSWRLPDSLASPIATLAVIAGVYLLASLFVRFTVHAGVRIFSIENHIEQLLIVRKFYILAAYIVATLVILWRLGLSASNLTVFLGLATTGVAFAMRDIIGAYFIWFMLLTKKPFRMGDYIRIGEDEGRVMHIGTFYVVLDENPDTRADYIRVPNQRFLQQSFYNYGHEELLVQVRVPFTEFTTDIDVRLERVRADLSREHPSPRVELDITRDKLVVFVETHTSEAARHGVRDKIIRAVIREFGMPKAAIVPESISVAKTRKSKRVPVRQKKRQG